MPEWGHRHCSVEQALDVFAPALPLAVACSAGADSTALLWACAQRWPGQVCAFHVDHGLQPAASVFAQHCAQLCTRLGVPLHLRAVDARKLPGQSPEDAARRARYWAFASMVEQIRQQGGVVASIALAQHANDQIETLLLALARGAGLRGLSAMPRTWVRDGIAYHRPWLDVSRQDIRRWLAGQGVTFVEDPSNDDPSFLRNRIRQQVLPALTQCMPQCLHTFARSSAHCAQAQQLLDDLAAMDLEQVGVPPRITALQTLATHRQANVLRHWLATCHGVIPSAAQLDELLRQIAHCRTRGHAVHLKVATGHCQRQGDALHWYNIPTPTH
ncbi:tRNA lysidine(34) synthetase TilS [Candidatus Symbiobacter mobilis]|nr:tRNA lysidine(34) synthetase TilS [Candidatus Symbiobacter mobilis]